MKIRWSRTGVRTAAIAITQREEWERSLSQDHFVVDLPSSDMDRFPSAAEWRLNQREMEPIHQVENGEQRTPWIRNVRTKMRHTFDFLWDQTTITFLNLCYKTQYCLEPSFVFEGMVICVYVCSLFLSDLKNNV